MVHGYLGTHQLPYVRTTNYTGPPVTCSNGCSSYTAACIPLPRYLVSITVLWNPVAPLTLLPDPILGHIWIGYFFR